MSLVPGTRLGNYQIVAPIGAGGMGEVYRAKDTRLDRDIAIKVLPAQSVGDAQAEAPGVWVRQLTTQSDVRSTQSPFTVILNWAGGLKK